MFLNASPASGRYRCHRREGTHFAALLPEALARSFRVKDSYQHRALGIPAAKVERKKHIRDEQGFLLLQDGPALSSGLAAVLQCDD
jgi:hypothetical protein